MYKNIDKNKILELKDEINYQNGQIVSKTLVQNDIVSMTIFSFDKNEEIATHTTSGDAMVMLLDGEGTFTIGEEVHKVKQGETLIMPKDIPHSVFASSRFKMLLIISY